LTHQTAATAKRRRAVTLKDVAARAGVGPMSVSVVLNGTQASTRVSEATRHQIIEAAEELGYRRNGGAAAARSGRFGSVALLMSTMPGRSFSSEGLFVAIHDELASHDLLMTFVCLPDEQLTNSSYVPKILRELSCDGLLLDYSSDIPPRLVELIAKFHIPVVWLNVEQPEGSIYPDDEGAAFEATQHLVQLGHKRILHVSHATSSHESVVNRRRGYERSMRASGLIPCIEEVDLDEKPEALHKRIKSWFGPSHPPTAFFAYEAEFALPVWLAAEKLGRRVPEDVSIVAIHDREVRVLGLQMTCWEIPVFEMGHIAVRKLLQKIENPNQKLHSEKVPFVVKTGQTCAPPNPSW
jgi:LacI family transcriptional regulator